MIELEATKYGYLPLSFTKNDMTVVVDSVEIENTDRSGLVYFCEIYVPKAYQSAEYVVFQKLRGSEIPPYTSNGSLTYDGCVFYIEDRIDALAEYLNPGLGLSGMTMQPLAVVPYRLKTWAERNGVLVAGSEVLTGVQYAIKGGLSAESFGLWKDSFFTDYIAGKWLTSQASEQLVGTTTKAVLSWLANISPVPANIRLKVQVWYSEIVTIAGQPRKSLLFEKFGMAGFSAYSLIDVPVGYEALGLGDDIHADKIKSWQVWLVDDENKRLTEKRRFVLDERYYLYDRCVLINNSFGGHEVVRFTGEAMEQLEVIADTGEKQLRNNYIPSDEETFVFRKNGKRSVKLSTGVIADPDMIRYMEEVALAEQYFLYTASGWTSVVLGSNVFVQKGDNEDIGQRVFEFVYSKRSRGFDMLGYREPAPARPTVWIPIGSYCLVNANGLRTGMQGAAELELYYADVQPYEKVRGVAKKANVPGTEGYVPPSASSVCVAGTAAAYNTAISKLGSFLANNCGAGNTGVAATITVAAGLFGGETVDLANKLADAEWKRRDTQEAANANPVGCVLTPENYSVSVGANQANFRWNSLQLAGAYAASYVVKQNLSGSVQKGNAWFIANAGVAADTYFSGTNNIKLPTNFETGTPWIFGIYIKSGDVVTNVIIYVNNVQVWSGNSSLAVDGRIVVELPHATIPAGAMVYIKCS